MTLLQGAAGDRWQRPPGQGEIRFLLLVALAVAAAAAVIFTLFPALDMAAAAYFRTGDGFALDQQPFWRLLRATFLRGFAVWYVTIAVACPLAVWWRRPVLRQSWQHWLYLALCSLAGPLLVTNILLKSHWGRWRPREIEGLGGGEVFTTPLDPSGTCPDNCSFVSGEVSSMVMAFIALALVSTRFRPHLYAATVVMGGLSALVRIGQGAHFLSDTLFAAAFMTAIAAAIYAWMFLGRARRPWHANAGRASRIAPASTERPRTD